MLTTTTIMDRAQRRRPTIAKEWQLAVLKKLQLESRNPTEEQRSAAAAETGLDEKWVKNWFTRQRSKLAARSRKSRTDAAVPTTFRLQLCYPPGMPSRRSVSPPAPYLPSPASLESCSPRPSHSTVNTQAIPRSRRSVSARTPSQNPTPVPHTTIPTYSRDPLCNRYPDFSQFFRPHVHQQFRTFALINSHQELLDMDSRAPTHFQGLFDLLNPLHLGGLSTSSLQPCPVAFSMRLVDFLDHSSLRYPVFPPPYHI